MTGLELSEKYFEEYGKPMLEEQFKEQLPYLAVGLVGSGSECFGFDDEISTDHDFEPGFCIFLPGEEIVDRKSAFAMERAYAKLPKEFAGFTRSMMSPVGGSRHGVIRTEEFYSEKIGKFGEIETEDWFHIPSYALAEATDGKIFFDNYGEFTKIRNQLKSMPKDVRLKKLAGQVLLMAQAGQYNFPRIIKHGEQAAAQMAIFEFAKATISTVFLLNNAHEPYYKWSFRAMRSLEKLSDVEDSLHYIMTTDNSEDNVEAKYFTIEEIAGEVIAEIKAQGISEATCRDLEKHAYSINDQIEDSEIRNRHILAAV